MTKLEKKIVDLGYIQKELDSIYYVKFLLNDSFAIYINLDNMKKKIKSKGIDVFYSIVYQHNIDDLQYVFNIMEEDYFLLIKYENK